jgi:hypothetical protein
VTEIAGHALCISRSSAAGEIVSMWIRAIPSAVGVAPLYVSGRLAVPPTDQCSGRWTYAQLLHEHGHIE